MTMGGEVMATYVILMNYTEQGVKALSETVSSCARMIKALEDAGGKLTAMYATMGQYDLVAVAEGPSDEFALEHLLRLSMAGNVRTTTLKAFSRDEFAAIVEKLA